MPIEHINPDAMYDAIYTQVVKVDKTVYIAGQVGFDQDENTIGIGDAEAQIRQIWRNFEAAVESVGGTLRNIVKVTTYVTDMACLPAWRKVWHEVYQGVNPPASTLVEVSRLARPHLLVEIEAIAVVDS